MSDELEQDQVEREARNMGWVPEEKFKGKNWVDAAEYVDKGKHVLPILQQNNRRLQDELLTRDKKIDTLDAQLKNTNKVIERLEAHYTEANKRAATEARKSLAAELTQARDDRDTEAEVRILESINSLKVAEDAPPKPDTPDKKDDSDNYNNQISPDFKAWESDNSWFGKDTKKTKGVTRAAEDLREEGSTLVGREFMDAALERYLDVNPDTQDDGLPPRPSPKVESGNNRNSARGRNDYNSLPAEAKAACMEDAETLVGAGKRYKTLADWQAKYNEIYRSTES